MAKTIQLKTELPCSVKHQLTGKIYKAKMHTSVAKGDFYGKWLISVERENGAATPATWYLSTLIEGAHDFIYIDAGEQWGITGMIKLIKEALTHI